MWNPLFFLLNQKINQSQNFRPAASIAEDQKDKRHNGKFNSQKMLAKKLPCARLKLL